VLRRTSHAESYRRRYLGEHGRACGVLVQQRRTLLQQREQWRLDDLQRALHT
jgi:hypothetical protein